MKYIETEFLGQVSDGRVGSTVASQPESPGFDSLVGWLVGYFLYGVADICMFS